MPTGKQTQAKPAQLNIIQALDDPAIFQPVFPDKKSWFAWRTYLSAIFALPMTAKQRAIFTECTGRQDLPTDPVRESWLCVGRKGGKSRVLALIATFVSCFIDWSKYLSVGERGIIMVVAQDRVAAELIMGYISANFRAVPMLKQLVVRETSDRIDLNNDISIRVHTCSIRGVRGPTVLCTIADEIAFWKDDTSTNPDEEVLAAARPAMATVGGGLLICASSPYARKGALWHAHKRHHGKPGDPILVWQAATRVMNPTVPQSLIDAALERDRAKNMAEFMAEFRTDVESFVSLEAVMACVDSGVYERPYSEQFTYFAFTDPSGGSTGELASSFTLAIGHIEEGQRVVDLTRQVKPPFSPEAVVHEYADIMHRYRIKRVYGDRYAGEWPREQFRKQGITYELCPNPKGVLYQSFLPMLNSGQVRMIDNSHLVNETINLERKTGRSGKDAIGPADRGHDDLINAVAGCLVMMRVQRKQTIIGCADGTYLTPDGVRHFPSQERQHSRLRWAVVDEHGREKPDAPESGKAA